MTEKRNPFGLTDQELGEAVHELVEAVMEYEVDMRTCPGCLAEMDRWEMEEVYDDQGIYAGLYCSYECAEKRGKIMLHRTDAEARAAGDWGEED